DAALQQALKTTIASLTQIDTELQNNVNVAANTQTLENTLHLTVAEFRRLMEFRARNNNQGTEHKPLTEPEGDELDTSLTQADKKREMRPIWLQQEEQMGLDVAYWYALKARIPLWRAPAEARQLWVQALKGRSRAPLIDPHLIGPGDIRNAVP